MLQVVFVLSLELGTHAQASDPGLHERVRDQDLKMGIEVGIALDLKIKLWVATLALRFSDQLLIDFSVAHYSASCS